MLCRLDCCEEEDVVVEGDCCCRGGTAGSGPRGSGARRLRSAPPEVERGRKCCLSMLLERWTAWKLHSVFVHAVDSLGFAR